MGSQSDQPEPSGADTVWGQLCLMDNIAKLYSFGVRFLEWLYDVIVEKQF